MNFLFQKPNTNRPLREQNLRYVLSGNTPVKISESQFIAEKHELVQISSKVNANGQHVYTYKRKKKGA